MSVTVYVTGWHEQPSEEVKVYLNEKYDGIGNEYWVEQIKIDPHIQKDEHGYFEMETVYQNKFPELEFTSARWSVFKDALNLYFDSEDHCGEIPYEQIQTVIKKCLVLLNTKHKSQLVSENVVEKNFIHCGLTQDYVERKLTSLLELLKFAFERKLGVFIVN